MKSIEQLKEEWAKKLVAAASKLDAQQKAQAALNLKISVATLYRYTSGDVKEVRRLELAESILNELKEVAAAPAV